MESIKHLPDELESSRMGRPREFDIDRALEDAMYVFWSHGYHATSLTDLTEAMHLKRGSLYAAFGNKHQLFLAAFDRYTHNLIEGTMATVLDGSSVEIDALDTLRTYLYQFAQRAVGDSGRRGCFIANTTLEMLPHDPVVHARITATFQRIEQLFTNAIQHAQRQGSIRAECDAPMTAGYLLCMIEGLRVVGKAGLSETEVHALIEIALSALR